MTKAELEGRIEGLAQANNTIRAERDTARKKYAELSSTHDQMRRDTYQTKGVTERLLDEVKWLRKLVSGKAPEVCGKYAPAPNSTSINCMYCGKAKWMHEAQM